VDGFVLTTYHRTAHRVRDAVIVSKAWRDGATVSDVINTAMLTRGTEYSYFIPRLPRTEGTTTDYGCCSLGRLFVGWLVGRHGLYAISLSVTWIAAQAWI
jgi:hypothetical protein